MHLPNNTILQGGKYRIVRFISSGGFGCTYEAEHVLLGKRVAIKEFFVKDFCNRDEVTSHVTVGTQSKVALVSKLKKKFIEEASALSRFNHPNIVHVSDVFEENGTAYYVMDFIDGKSIHEILKTQSTIPEAKAVKYITQLAEALKQVHAQNRLHLDIKPGNIIIDSNDNAILIDFGASKQYDEVAGENTSTLVGRTPGYAPLEQMGNNVKKFSAATDIYSLGATAYKMVTGVTPPEATDLASGEELPPIPQAISRNFRLAVSRALQLQKNNRPQSVEDFVRLLSQRDDEDELTLMDEPSAAKIKPIESSTSNQAPSTPIRQDSSDASNRLTPAHRSKKKQNWIIAVIACIMLMGVCCTIYASLHGAIVVHDYVDLGLPSGTKWATCNIGANSPSDYGYYYAWGETKTKASYNIKNCEWQNVPFTRLVSLGVIGTNGNLTPKHDTASVNWGSDWRMPTSGDIEELKERCTWIWTNKDGHNGYLITGPNGNSIFLPAADDFSNDKNTLGKTDYGYYWSATAYDNDKGYELFINKHSKKCSTTDRYRGLTIRPVRD